MAAKINKLFIIFIILDLMFVSVGGLMIGGAITWLAQRAQTPNQQTVATVLLLSGIPMTAMIANGVLIFVTFLVSLPALALPTSITWLRVHTWLVVVCTIFTLGLGINIWLETLTTRANLGNTWAKHSPDIQSLLQQQFTCCGYTNSTSPGFVKDSTCPNDIIAATLPGCVGPFSGYANNMLQTIFDAAFGIVGLDVVLILCTMMLAKVRDEQRRYRLIDRKRGLSNI